jgi:hypothetical protein
MNDSIDELSRLKVAKIAPTETPLIENVIHNTALAFELSVPTAWQADSRLAYRGTLFLSNQIY